MAYVCLIPSISTGTRVFVEDSYCVDISNYNLREYVHDKDSTIFVVVKWNPSSSILHPHLRCYCDGQKFDTVEFDNEWEVAYQGWYLPIGCYIFQFLGDYGEEPLMHVAFDVVEEISDPDEIPEPEPEPEETIDYNKINDYTYVTGSHVMGNNKHYDLLSAGRDAITDEIIENEFNNLQKSLLEDNSNLLNGQSVIKHMINAMDTPDMTEINSNISNLTSAMNGLNIPDLTQTNLMLSGLKDSVDSLDTSGIEALSSGIHDSEQTTISETNKLAVRQSTFHDYTWNHLNNIQANLTNSVEYGWMALGGAIDNLSIPTVSEIVNGIGDITPTLPDITFPTLDGIKETFISVATEIADKILERVWDEIERRYDK